MGCVFDDGYVHVHGHGHGHGLWLLVVTKLPTGKEFGMKKIKIIVYIISLRVQSTPSFPHRLQSPR